MFEAEFAYHFRPSIIPFSKGFDLRWRNILFQPPTHDASFSIRRSAILARTNIAGLNLSIYKALVAPKCLQEEKYIAKRAATPIR